MQNISFNDGYKEFTINNDESKVIRFNPSDFGILQRIKEAYDEIDKATDIDEDIKLNPDGTVMENLGKTVKIVKGIEDTIKNQVDHIFNSDISEMVFGKQSPLGMVKGVPLYERFLNAAIPFIKKEVETEMKASQKRMSKYTDVVK